MNGHRALGGVALDLGLGIRTSALDHGSVAQHVTQRRRDQGNPCRNGHFGAVRNHAVRAREQWSEESERPGRVQEHEVGLVALNGLFDCSIGAEVGKNNVEFVTRSIVTWTRSQRRCVGVR